MDNEIIDFTRQALDKGVGRDEVATALRQAGWPEGEVKGALASFIDSPFGIPVPRPRPYLSAGEVFLYLIMFTALYDSAFSLGAILFHLIDRAFPDLYMPYSWSDLGLYIRWHVASLLVMFPLFVYTFRLAARQIAENPSRRGSKPRKWLIYLTLFSAALALTCDVTTLVYNLLGGEITLRFIMKVLTVAVIGGGIFTFFLHDVRQDETP